MQKEKPGQAIRHLEFKITTANPLPAGEQVFISGNDPALGTWQADGLPLNRISDNLWTGSAWIPAALPCSFKITRGNWETEEAHADNTLPSNKTIPPGGDELIEHTVLRWQDGGPGPTPNITGNYRIWESMHSEFLKKDRTVVIWLPPGYAQETDKRYPVLYMQDGQQVFDPQTSTWGQDWEVDEWCTRLIEEKTIQEIIVVAAYCTDDRQSEYNPKDEGERYIRFLLDELKPQIDAKFRTNPDREHTAIAGASMGAALAFYAAWRHPDKFFGAACLSPVFNFENHSVSFDDVKNARNMPDLKIFLYCGGGDPIDKHLLPPMREMAGLLRNKGFKDHGNLLVVEQPSAEHNEKAWRDHTDQWLTFLFPA